MKSTLLSTLFLFVFLTSCLTDPSVEPDPITVCPPPAVILSRDSIARGSYLGLTINDEAEKRMPGFKPSGKPRALPF